MGILLGALSAAQLLIDPEVLVYCGILSAVGLSFLALTHRHEVVSRLRVAAPGLIGAIGCFGAIAGYPIVYFLAGPRRIPRGIQAPQLTAGFHLDLLRPILPSAARVTNTSGYLGAPLLIGLVVLAVRWRKLGAVQLAAVCACAAFVLSLGPRLTVDGRTYAVWLPAAVFEHVPVLLDLEPIRITGLGMLFLAIILAVGLDRTRTSILEHARTAPKSSKRSDEPRRDRVTSRLRSAPNLQTLCLLALAIAAFVPLLGQLPVAGEHRATEPALTASLARSVPHGAVVLAFPYPRARSDDPMLWQAADEMSFRLVGGYALVPGAAGRGRYYVAQSPDLARLSALLAAPSGVPRVSLTSACQSLEAVLGAEEVDALVLGTKPGPIRTQGIRLLTKLLGPPKASFAAGVAWYGLRSRGSPPSCPVDS